MNATGGVGDTPPNAKKPIQVIGKNKYGNAYIDANKTYWSIQNRTHSGEQTILDLFWMSSLQNPVGGNSTGTGSGSSTGSNSSLGTNKFANASGSMDGSWYDSPSSTISTTNNLPYKIAAIGVSLLVIYGVVYVASKAWSKGEA